MYRHARKKSITQKTVHLQWKSKILKYFDHMFVVICCTITTKFLSESECETMKVKPEMKHEMCIEKHVLCLSRNIDCKFALIHASVAVLSSTPSIPTGRKYFCPIWTNQLVDNHHKPTLNTSYPTSKPPPCRRDC